MAEISNAFLAALVGKTIKRADSSTDDELRLEFDSGERVVLVGGGNSFEDWIDVLESTL